MDFKRALKVGKKSCVECSKHGGGLGNVYAPNEYYCEKERKDRSHKTC